MSAAKHLLKHIAYYIIENSLTLYFRKNFQIPTYKLAIYVPTPPYCIYKCFLTLLPINMKNCDLFLWLLNHFSNFIQIWCTVFMIHLFVFLIVAKIPLYLYLGIHFYKLFNLISQVFIHLF